MGGKYVLRVRLELAFGFVADGTQEVERSLKIILANPEQVKALRGKKTDPNDSRMASLLRHGLVQGSFIHETFVNCGI